MDLSYYKNMEPFFGSWHIKRLIGEGNFGKVFEIERQDFGRTYSAALKAITIPQNDSELKSVMADGMDEKSISIYFRGFVEEMVSEFALMSTLKGNTNIVSYEDHQVIEHTDSIGWDILIRMELLTPLVDHINTKGMTRRDVVRLGVDMCRALEFCQKQSIIHRDIKPENIFISRHGDYKLGDFGIARTAEKSTSGLSKKGTYNYMAPEVYLGQPYGPSVDLYSLGLVLYRLLNNNRAPFLPPYPEPITFSNRETSNIRRIHGDKMDPPANADAALAAVVLKACAYRAEDRFDSPEAMRFALERLLPLQDARESICGFAAVSRSFNTASVPFAATGTTDKLLPSSSVPTAAPNSVRTVVPSVPTRPTPAAKPASAPSDTTAPKPVTAGTVAPPPVSPRPQAAPNPPRENTSAPQPKPPAQPPTQPQRQPWIPQSQPQPRPQQRFQVPPQQWPKSQPQPRPQIPPQQATPPAQPQRQPWIPPSQPQRQPLFPQPPRQPWIPPSQPQKQSTPTPPGPKPPNKG